jgi:hypothetical protein
MTAIAKVTVFTSLAKIMLLVYTTVQFRATAVILMAMLSSCGNWLVRDEFVLGSNKYGKQQTVGLSGV